jgi:lysosomal acid lipase/cholesteryl ester hydrolase
LICAKDKSPPFVLAHLGYDVWMQETRGTEPSKFHKYLDSEVDKEYWDFSWEEMGEYDSKATIEYIKENSNYDKVAYLGMSQGAAQMLHALSQDNEWGK